MDIELDVVVRAALQKRRGDWPRIAVNAEVSHSWISQFVRKKIPNPGYATLRRLQAELQEEIAGNPRSCTSTSVAASQRAE